MFKIMNFANSKEVNKYERQEYLMFDKVVNLTDHEIYFWKK